MSEASSPIGKSVGNYVIASAIGAGAMGAVYLAEHPEIGRRVAVKLLPAHIGLTPGFADRFRAEARAVAKIEHPNVIEIYDYGQTTDGQLYYSMELLKGRELAAVIKEQAPMVPEAVLPYLEQMGGALQASHDSGVVHRDLKPENIFVLERQPLVVKLLDFGLAKLTTPEAGTSQTATGLVMGTPLSIAPEQAAGRVHEVGPHSDIYSLGVILYWMLCGEPPFRASSVAMLLAKHISEAAPRLGARVPSLSPALAAVVDRCLLKDYHERPPSAQAVVQAFAAALTGTASETSASAPVEAATDATPASKPVAQAPTLRQVVAVHAEAIGTSSTFSGELTAEGASLEVELPRRAWLLWVGLGTLLLGGAAVATLLLGPFSGGPPSATDGHVRAARPAADATPAQPPADAAVDARRDARKPDLGVPAAKRPVVKRPVVKRPAVKRPVVKRPVVKRPVVKRPVVKRPVVNKPVADKPVADKPVVKKPIVTLPPEPKVPPQKPRLGSDTVPL